MGPLDASFKQYQYNPGMDVQGQVPFDEQGLVTQLTASAQVNAAEGWVSGLDHTLIQNALTTYQDQVRVYITAQNPDATVGEVLGTKADGAKWSEISEEACLIFDVLFAAVPFIFHMFLTQ
jgi:hypothetical protein